MKTAVAGLEPGVHFITGTDTGVGKTVFTALLLRALRAAGIAVVAVKPFCSGGRGDARALFRALGGSLPMEAINPWHFRAPLTPLLAARRCGRKVSQEEVLQHIRHVATGAGRTLVEGAGGLLSPLGEDYAARELLVALRATPWIVCPNRLGALNQCRLALAALPRPFERRARLVLMSGPAATGCARSNRDLLGEFIDPQRIVSVPYLGSQPLAAPVPRVIHRLAQASGGPADAVGPGGPGRQRRS